ncbi:hypothetical protein HMPREF2534_03106 [Bacteroides thetaiotaomicron]|nr:hypothetical protein HMPREF2534_03106 [Bacteroides thetaiotaomicron]
MVSVLCLLFYGCLKRSISNNVVSRLFGKSGWAILCLHMKT